MIELDELRVLYGAAMESMPAAERDLVENCILKEEKELDYRRSRGISRKEFVACMESALTRMRQFLKTQRVETVADVF
jgi:hypothetical protein